MTPDDLIKRAIAFANARFAKGNNLDPMAIVFLKNPSEIMLMPFKAEDKDFEQIRKSNVMMAIWAARSLGRFDSLLMVSEAWASSNPEYAKPGKMPRMDPEAEDVAMFVCKTEKEQRHSWFKVGKKDGKPHLEGKDLCQEGMKIIHQWFDGAFETPPKPIPLHEYTEKQLAFALLVKFYAVNDPDLSQN